MRAFSLCGGVGVHACAACGRGAHVVCVVPLKPVKIAHRWRVRVAIRWEGVSAGFDVDESSCGDLAVCQPMTALPVFTHSQGSYFES